MPRHALSHIRHWVFDLDNTLYPPHERLFDQIEEKMRQFMKRELGMDPAEADVLRRSYWQKYGTTLAGLMAHHDIDPDQFLHEVHQIDFGLLSPALDLAKQIDALPGRKIVFTNGTVPYAQNVLRHLGLSPCFEKIYGIETAKLTPKPHPAAFEHIFGLDGLTRTEAAMFEDDPRNLKVPHDMGLSTIHVAPEPEPEPHIHHHTSDLAAFLSAL